MRYFYNKIQDFFFYIFIDLIFTIMHGKHLHKMGDKPATSSVARPFYIANSTLLETSSLAPTDITFLSIIFCNLLRSLTDREAKNPKVLIEQNSVGSPHMLSLVSQPSLHCLYILATGPLSKTPFRALL